MFFFKDDIEKLLPEITTPKEEGAINPQFGPAVPSKEVTTQQPYINNLYGEIGDQNSDGAKISPEITTLKTGDTKQKSTNGSLPIDETIITSEYLRTNGSDVLNRTDLVFDEPRINNNGMYQSLLDYVTEQRIGDFERFTPL